MRSASRIFAALGVFSAIAVLLLVVGYGGGVGGARVQASVILAMFGLACTYLSFAMRAEGRRELDGLHVPEPTEQVGEIHLPGPSIFPALYGLVGAVIVLGLVFRTEVAIAGVVLLVVTTVGWARESVADYRREVAHASHGSDEVYSPEAIAAAHKVQAFSRAHHGADAVVHHLGNGKGEIAVVGRDGAWGTITTRNVSEARTAVTLAGVGLHESWTASIAAIKADKDHWRRMAGPAAPSLPHGPRDGATQVGAKLFAPLAAFGVIAAALLYVGYGSEPRGARLQGGLILSFFGVACGYLYLALRHARAAHDDHVWADETGVTREPSQPDPPVDLETLHLPGPSIWPAAYSVAGAVLVLGLVWNTTWALVGVALIVVCTVGWGVESVREYRATLGHDPHGAGHAVPDHTASAH